MTLSLTLLFSETRELSPEKRGYQIVVRRVHMIIVSKDDPAIYLHSSFDVAFSPWWLKKADIRLPFSAVATIN